MHLPSGTGIARVQMVKYLRIASTTFEGFRGKPLWISYQNCTWQEHFEIHLAYFELYIYLVKSKCLSLFEMNQKFVVLPQKFGLYDEPVILFVLATGWIRGAWCTWYYCEKKINNPSSHVLYVTKFEETLPIIVLRILLLFSKPKDFPCLIGIRDYPTPTQSSFQA